jgi:hypothetical protein
MRQFTIYATVYHLCALLPQDIARAQQAERGEHDSSDAQREQTRTSIPAPPPSGAAAADAGGSVFEARSRPAVARLMSRLERLM